ncbi:hypothetical protein FGO68_gene9441 [Halteria grandinella]|uniref:Uncharacterized protein n=1 Tax=Halteria grandinella TaxID=5974 RepID=A0A8J8T5C6_HALGN|nr:hypothetical protein FGO68_gene9441 [Halteria grandinella]
MRGIDKRNSHFVQDPAQLSLMPPLIQPNSPQPPSGHKFLLSQAQRLSDKHLNTLVPPHLRSITKKQQQNILLLPPPLPQPPQIARPSIFLSPQNPFTETQGNLSGTLSPQPFKNLPIISPQLMNQQSGIFSPKNKRKVSADYLNFGFDLVKLSAKETEAATKLMAKEFSKDVGPVGKRKRAEKLRSSLENQTEPTGGDDKTPKSPKAKQKEGEPEASSPGPQIRTFQQLKNFDFAQELLQRIPEKFTKHIQNRIALEEFIDKQQNSKKVKNYARLPVEIQNFIFRCVQEKRERDIKMKKHARQLLQQQHQMLLDQQAANFGKGSAMGNFNTSSMESEQLKQGNNQTISGEQEIFQEPDYQLRIGGKNRSIDFSRLDLIGEEEHHQFINVDSLESSLERLPEIISGGTTLSSYLPTIERSIQSKLTPSHVENKVIGFPGFGNEPHRLTFHKSKYYPENAMLNRTIDNRNQASSLFNAKISDSSTSMLNQKPTIASTENANINESYIKNSKELQLLKEKSKQSVLRSRLLNNIYHNSKTSTSSPKRGGMPVSFSKSKLDGITPQGSSAQLQHKANFNQRPFIPLEIVNRQRNVKHRGIQQVARNGFYPQVDARAQARALRDVQEDQSIKSDCKDDSLEQYWRRPEQRIMKKQQKSES